MFVVQLEPTLDQNRAAQLS